MWITAPNLPPQIPEWPSIAVTSAQVAAPPPHGAALDLSPLAYIYDSGNSVTIEQWVEPTARHYQPKTLLGARLLALRNAYISGGGELLSVEDLDMELRARRGELDYD